MIGSLITLVSVVWESSRNHSMHSRHQGSFHTGKQYSLHMITQSHLSTNGLFFLPLIVLQIILDGARKWNGPLLGLVLVRFRRKSRYFTRKRNEWVKLWTVVQSHIRHPNYHQGFWIFNWIILPLDSEDDFRTGCQDISH